VEAAVVVTYAAPPGMLAACLDAISEAGGVGHVVVVDTGGRAHTDEHVAELAAAGTIELVETENHGYGAAANIGFAHARAAGAAAVALLNDDVLVRPGWIEALVAELGAGIGAAQPKLLVAHSDPPVVNSLGVRIGRDGAGTDVGLGDLDVGTAMSSDLAIFTGGTVVFTDAFIDATGGFDERWFLYYEDVDLARRGAELGWRYRLVPSAVVEHHGGVTTSAMAARTRFLQERNRLWSAFRHEPPATVRRAVWLSVRRLRHTPRGLHAKALASGFAGAPRMLRERRIAAARHRS
jgi:GT2 family glycosyltransferase